MSRTRREAHQGEGILRQLGELGELVPCTTCDGTGVSEYRGASHYDYDEPNYSDNCAICGGGGELPASMFNDAEDEEEEYEDA
jgi:hypothetical protein